MPSMNQACIRKTSVDIDDMNSDQSFLIQTRFFPPFWTTAIFFKTKRQHNATKSIVNERPRCHLVFISLCIHCEHDVPTIPHDYIVPLNLEQSKNFQNIVTNQRIKRGIVPSQYMWMIISLLMNGYRPRESIDLKKYLSFNIKKLRILLKYFHSTEEGKVRKGIVNLSAEAYHRPP